MPQKKQKTDVGIGKMRNENNIMMYSFTLLRFSTIFFMSTLNYSNNEKHCIYEERLHINDE